MVSYTVAFRDKSGHAGLLLNGLAAIERGEDPPPVLRDSAETMLMIGSRNAVITPDAVPAE